MFRYEWKNIDTILRVVDYTISYNDGLLSLQEMIVMTITNNFLLLNIKGHRFPWNLLYVIKYIVENGIVYAWVFAYYNRYIESWKINSNAKWDLQYSY